MPDQAGRSSAPGEPAPRDISEAPPHIQTTIRAYAAAFNGRNPQAALPEVAEEKTCSTRGDVLGRLDRLLHAFSDLQISRLRAYDLGSNRVGVRFVLSGTNDGELAPGVPATGRRIEAEMFDMVQFDDRGRVVDGRNLSELAPVRRQLGVDDVDR